MILLDTRADTFPVGLAGTPFEEVYKALRIVAADAWSVDPTVYRAGMAWGWYALHEPAALASFRDVAVAALISAMAPMVKETQTDAELVEYLRQWREYTPTFPKLQNLYKLFAADVDIEPISDPESQAVLPVEDTRLAFYIRIEGIDFSRPLTLAEAREIALRATPMGSRPYAYYAVPSHVRVPVATVTGLEIVTRVENWESAVAPIPPAPPVVLPTVTLISNLYISPDSYNHQIGSGNQAYLYEYYNGSYRGILYDDATKKQCVYGWRYYPTGGPWQKFYYGVSAVNSGDSLAVKNETQNTINVTYILYAESDDPTTTVVTVYDSSNAAYNAFKYTADNTDYYYVLDGTQTDWTDDLSGIGYSEVSPAPSRCVADG